MEDVGSLILYSNKDRSGAKKPETGITKFMSESLVPEGDISKTFVTMIAKKVTVEIIVVWDIDITIYDVNPIMQPKDHNKHRF